MESGHYWLTVESSLKPTSHQQLYSLRRVESNNEGGILWYYRTCQALRGVSTPQSAIRRAFLNMLCRNVQTEQYLDSDNYNDEPSLGLLCFNFHHAVNLQIRSLNDIVMAWWGTYVVRMNKRLCNLSDIHWNEYITYI